MGHVYDLLIIGGGINGAAIARDAAGRGLSVLLCERDDLASHTSSASTKLIHGGLRYLEYYEFRLVREALKEREVMLRAAPHIIWPMRFVLPYDKGLRPAWMLRVGLFLYDRLGGRKLLPGTTVTKFKSYPLKGVLEPRFKFGYEYSDCWVEDARLVCLNAMQAEEKGADIRTRTEVLALATEGGLYHATIKPQNGTPQIVQAKGVINAAGPWVEQMLSKIKTPDENDAGLRLIKGSHIVTKKLFEGDHSYIFQNADNRIIFAIPYEGDFTLIGTTDVPYDHSEGHVKISQDEIDYLCNAANEYFQNDISPDDVVWTYSGVRPLYDDKSENASAVTRDYVLDIEKFDGAPLMSIYGGKITTSRKLAEHAMEKLEKFFPDMGKAWTRDAVLPGGRGIRNADFEGFFADCVTRYPWASRSMLRRLARAYGSRLHEVLDGSNSMDSLGAMFECGLSEAEIAYLIDHEFVRDVDDVLWRRSKLGLHMSAKEQARLRAWFSAFDAG